VCGTRRGVEPLNSEGKLRDMIGPLHGEEEGWREIGLCLVDLGLNVVMREGRIGDVGAEGEKCYRAFHGRRAPCRGCAATETIRDGEPHSSVCERGWRGTRTRCRVDAYPVRDATGVLWGVVERIFEGVSRQKKAE
jgi:hypothetical protein